MSSDAASSGHLKDGVIDFTAGSLGGIALVYVGQPLDTVKVKMQTFPEQYSNMIDCFKKTIKSDGIAKGLYAGTGPALVANITENSVLFLCYGLCQKFVQKIVQVENTKDLTAVHNATAGFIASFFSSLALCPTELVKCKLQAMQETELQHKALGKKFEKLGSWKLVAHIFREEGTRGLFRGLVPTLVREMPGYFFFFGGYEGAREVLAKPGQSKEDIGLGRTMVAGAFGGASFWTLTYPVDVAKSRIQVMNSNLNMVQMIMDIAKREGVSALYNGLKPTLIRTLPATSTLFATYEYSKIFLHKVIDL